MYFVSKNVRYLVSTLIFFFFPFSLCWAQLSPSIEIRPGDFVEVGEEVFFSARGTTHPDPELLKRARYEWDFGDGYFYRFDPVIKSITRSGIVCVHYFMKPGTFNVTLKVSIWDKWDSEGNPIGEPLEVKSTSRTIQVEGEAPIKGFEIQRAPFQNRLAQYLYVQIPSPYRGNQTYLRVKVVGSGRYETILLHKNNLSAEEKVLLDHRPLPKGEYVLIAELIDASGRRIQGGIWRDKFEKPYEGIPKIGIDENNSFLLNGKPFFRISAFMVHKNDIPKFINLANINLLSTVGYYPEHSPSTWGNYLDLAEKYGLLAAGPGRGSYEVAPTPNRWKFNHDPEIIRDYVRTNKDKPALFSWHWQDEPNLGGRAQKVYLPTLAAWVYICHEEDPFHPVGHTWYGYDWLRYYGDVVNIWDYLGSGELMGGKKWVQDFIVFDIYPIAYRLHPTLNYPDMGPYAAYLDGMDRMHRNNKNLVPIIPAIMPCNRNPNESVLIHTSEQVYMEAWMNVVHGAKGISWFPFFDMANSGRWDAMKKFADQMENLAPVVLGPEPARTIADDANEPLRRVDTMIREYDGNIYVFAVRITEPDPIPGAKFQGIEPERITVNFAISDLLGNGVAEVIDENRQISINDGRFSDTFHRNAVHIYKIPLPRGTTISPPRGLKIIN